jgi:hypothetical protein
VLSGVPAFGADFLRGPKSHAKIVKAWLKFYRENQRDLTGGNFKPLGDFVFPNHKIESSRAAFIYLRFDHASPILLDGTPEVIYLANCTEVDRISVAIQGLPEGIYQAESLDLFLEPISTRTVGLKEHAEIHAFVPQGGMLKLIRLKR